MIPFEKAFEIVLDKVRQLPSESVSIDQALGRILAADVKSDIDMPPFRKSAMDGYACRRQDLSGELTIIENIPAGRVPQKSIAKNQCAKIMTGAMVPEGTDCVVMVEFTDNPTEQTMRFAGKRTADNICAKGQDIRAGDVVLHRGTRIAPEHIAVLAAVGCITPIVSCQPTVGIIATGDELVEPADKPAESQIRNSNSYQLVAQATAAGAIPRYYGIAGDCEDSIDAMLKEAIAETDVVLLSGGVSMGDFDLVPAVLRQNGIELIFEKVAIKPGKPTVFGVSDDVFCIGLPGNPVSTFMLFELLVKPFLYKMMGHDFRPAVIRIPLEKTVTRKRTERKSLIPIVLTKSGGAIPVKYHGSAHINALCAADGIISMPVGVEEIKEGTVVDVRQL